MRRLHWVLAQAERDMVLPKTGDDMLTKIAALPAWAAYSEVEKRLTDILRTSPLALKAATLLDADPDQGITGMAGSLATYLVFSARGEKIYKIASDFGVREGEVFVRSHPRWQPCGPGRAQIKLVWVKEHTKTYGGGEQLQL